MIYVVGIGPGGAETITPQAMKILQSCDVIAGYEKYVDLVKDLVPGKILYTSGMTHEAERCGYVLFLAKDFGLNVALVSSGDPGVYGMAGLMLETASGSSVEVRIIPGITAANSCAAILGAPLMNDYAAISLSDRLTEWQLIEKRLLAASSGDFVICLYNPASSLRPDNLKKACDVIMRRRDSETPAGYVRNAGRGNEASRIMTLGQLRECNDIDMFCTVIVGNSKTYILDGKMITPRGYRLE
ncbi:MAG: precorrin-3B C(17)-methyltransferase [Synergistaceae bacterium]|nr:precorrin-3B C(17)-methyltransferase [Synergistaceae bacterium]